MRTMKSTGLRYQAGVLEVLDQQQLPQTEKWIVCDSYPVMIECIKTLKIRGAPLIGVAAVLMLATLLEQDYPPTEIEKIGLLLREARPTAVNLRWGVDRFIAALHQSPSIAFNTAETIFFEDVVSCEKMAAFGAPLLKSAKQVLTHCNSGSLATAGIGTALGVIISAAKQQALHVFVDETRPLLQGARLTAWELMKAKIPYTLICDNMAAYLMQQKKIDAVLVGADRIAKNGDFANKIGTYSLAIAANYHKIPFYVVAPYSTFDLTCESGQSIVIEQRAPDEVRGFMSSEKLIPWSPDNCAVYNPAFDITPANLVTAYISDRRILTASEIILL